MGLTSFLAIACTAAILSACQRSPESTATSTPPANPAPPPGSAAVSDKREYQCGEISVSADFHGTGPVRLRFNGTELTLPQVESGSGARYADELGNEFWNKGDEAMFTIAGQQMRRCSPAATPPERPQE
jgi:membrane-bound inhibitor of C-type lysozyme